MPISDEQSNTRDNFKINVLQCSLIFAISSLVLICGTANYYISAQSPILEIEETSEELPHAGIILTIIGAVLVGIIVSIRKKRKTKLSSN